MKTPLPVIVDVLDRHGLNTMSVFDVGEKLRLYFMEGKPEELGEKVRELSRQLDGSFVVKAWKRTPRQSGRRPDAEATYTWIVQGKKEDATVQGVVAGGIPDEVVNELAQLRAEKLFRERMDAVSGADDEEEDDDAVDGDPMGRLVDMLGDLLKPKETAPKAASTVKGHPSSMTKERMARILVAVKNCHEMDPDTFAQYESVLLTQYGQRKTA